MKKGHRQNKEQALWVPASVKPTACESQDFWLYPGLILIAYLPRGVQKDCHKGQLFEVQGFGEEEVTLKDIESKVERVLPLCFVRDATRLGFAFTSHSAQGRGLGNEASEDEPERGPHNPYIAP